MDLNERHLLIVLNKITVNSLHACVDLVQSFLCCHSCATFPLHPNITTKLQLKAWTLFWARPSASYTSVSTHLALSFGLLELRAGIATNISPLSWLFGGTASVCSIVHITLVCHLEIWYKDVGYRESFHNLNKVGKQILLHVLQEYTSYAFLAFHFLDG